MRLSLVCLLISLLCACQSSKVAIDYDTHANFTGLHTYTWMTEDSGTEKNFDPLLAERVQKAIAAQLPEIPLTPSEVAEEADVGVRYYIGSAIQTRESNTRGGIGIGSYGGNTSMGISLSLPLGGDKTVKKAQIVIDFINPADQKLIWRGTNRIDIGEESPEDITAKVNAAVAEILEKYPPG